jgi:hypothetical protein
MQNVMPLGLLAVVAGGLLLVGLFAVILLWDKKKRQ